MFGKRSGWLVFSAIAVAIWFAWEIVKVPLAVRAPPELAVRLAPNSPDVLGRAAEAEFAAKRIDNAKALAAESLSRAPFNVRALRTFGLGLASAGDADRADEALTLAGNWSLRDDPSHAWLIERRLREGNYGSAFAHADTLARRRPGDAKPIYDLFGAAALQDSRSLGPLAKTLEANPPWRAAFIDYLVKRQDTDAVLLTLGVILNADGSSYSGEELQWVYQSWFSEGRIGAIKMLRARLDRPPASEALMNGDFDLAAGARILPFDWNLAPTPGVTAEIISDDLSDGNDALWVEYDGYSAATVAEQALLIDPGHHVLVGMVRVEVSPRTSRLKWSVRCIETGGIVGEWRVPPASDTTAAWVPFQFAFDVPTTGCSMQTIRLISEPGDRRSSTVAWFDKLTIVSGKPGQENHN